MQDKSERAFKVNLTKSHLLVGDQVDTCEVLSKVILEGEKVKLPVNMSVDVDEQAGEFLSKTVLEGNVQEIRNLQLSFKMEIDSCLGLIKTGRMMYGADLKRGSENVITKMDPGLGSLHVQPNKQFRKTYFRRRQSRQQNHWHVKHKAIVKGMGIDLIGEQSVGHRVSNKASLVLSRFLGSSDMEVEDRKFGGNMCTVRGMPK
jgi:hypothetical protein